MTRDVGVVAKAYPDTKFIVYHSAMGLGPTDADESEYNPTNTKGTDRLIRTVLENGLVGKNVYAELGSVWAQVMNSTVLAQRVIGKLVKHLGPDHVLWGSECIWFGSPQPQIEAFRVFNISKEFQTKYQATPSSPRRSKRRIFGLNSAGVYGVDPHAIRCKVNQTSLAPPEGRGGRRARRMIWTFQDVGGPRTRREFLNLCRASRAASRAETEVGVVGFCLWGAYPPPAACFATAPPGTRLRSAPWNGWSKLGRDGA